MLNKTQLPIEGQALPGRSEPLVIDNQHFVLARPLLPPFPQNTASILFGMGCFWGAERHLWKQEGVYSTAVGYAGGVTSNPTYEEVCSGATGHTEVVLVVYEDRPAVLDNLLKAFWLAHDPTQGMRQGNDVGTQYRSAIYCYDEGQKHRALASMKAYQSSLDAANYGRISTEIAMDKTLYYAETYHQQYLAKNPGGYCGLGGTGVCFID